MRCTGARATLSPWATRPGSWRSGCARGSRCVTCAGCTRRGRWRPPTEGRWRWRWRWRWRCGGEVRVAVTGGRGPTRFAALFSRDSSVDRTLKPSLSLNLNPNPTPIWFPSHFVSHFALHFPSPFSRQAWTSSKERPRHKFLSVTSVAQIVPYSAGAQF